MKNIYRHGDLSFQQVETLPENLEKIKHGGSFVLALGEHTGHKHVMTAPKVSSMNIFKDVFGNFILDLREETTLSHEEHKEIVFKPGVYKMQFEQEYDYFQQEIAKVQD